MSDLTQGKVFCRISQTWVAPEERDQTRNYYDELAFQRSANQGELATPMVIFDGQPALKSMTNGKLYDSKSEMRKEYRRAGVEEVGTDTKANRQRRTWTEERDKRKKQREGIKAALHKAHSRMGFGAV